MIRKPLAALLPFVLLGAVAHVGTDGLGGSTTNTLSISVTAGQTPTLGNVLFISFESTASNTCSAPAGWTAITATLTANQCSFYRVVQSGDTASLGTFSVGTKPGTWCYDVSEWSGVDTTTPLAGKGTPTSLGSTNPQTLSYPAPTTASGVPILPVWSGTSTVTFATAPTGWSFIDNPIGNTNSSGSCKYGTLIADNAAETTSGSVSLSGSVSYLAAYQAIEINPAAGGGSPVVSPASGFATVFSSTTATISSGTSPYTCSSGAASIATCAVASTTLTTTCVSQGNATITVTDNASATATYAIACGTQPCGIAFGNICVRYDPWRILP